MENYSAYNQLLQKQMMVGKVFGIIVILILIILVLMCIKNELKSTAIITVIVGIGVLLILHFFVVSPYKQDVEENGYIEYVGDFYVERAYSVNRGGEFILIKLGEDKTIRLKSLCNILAVEDDSNYSGTVIYSKRSKCLVDIAILE